MHTRKGKYINKDERVFIERSLSKHYSVSLISRLLKRSRTTIYSEIQRGLCTQWDSNRWEFKTVYCWDYAQRQAEINASRKGRNLKIGNDHETARALCRVIKDGFSPYAALIKTKKNKSAKTILSVQTLYTYIHEGIIGLDDNDLLFGKYKKKKKTKFSDRRDAWHGLQHQSIEERPKSVLSRREFGHWEGDTVIGKKGTKGVFLTLLERKTRFLISLWMPDRKNETVVKAFDAIEKHFGSTFAKIFKSVTFDNGVEFADINGIGISPITGNKRIENIYFAHPYCSGERGSNEVVHRFIRRKYPKGKSLENVDLNEYREYINKVNYYPRKLHDGACAIELFKAEITQI